MDASNLLKPALQGGKLRTMGSTTYKEFRQHFEKDRALSRRFQKIDVNEPSVDDAVKILQVVSSPISRITIQSNTHRMRSKLRVELAQPLHQRPEAAGLGH